MPSLRDRLRDSKPLVADGAMGTMLQQFGSGYQACPEELNLSSADTLRAVARAYVEAGSHLVHTNTFGASPIRLAAHGLADQVGEINRVAVIAVQDAVGEAAYVSGSMGPSGELLKPLGTVSEEDLRESFRVQAQTLVEAGVDAMTIETMTDLREATIALQAVRDISADLPLLATMTFDRTPRGFFTVMGVNIERAAKGLAEAGAEVVGSNCGNGSETMVEIAREFARCTDAPLLIQPNAGLPKLIEGKNVYGESPEFMATQAAALLDLGVKIIGGCCGTTPGHIRALRALME
jgi:5-methyltetrahydrofolate--homocysteine methyltransferase